VRARGALRSHATPVSLAEANVAYTLVDDLPFIAAGFEAEELFGAYIAEDRGQIGMAVSRAEGFALSDSVSQTAETIAYLGKSRASASGGVAAFGDDMEKIRLLARHLQALLRGRLAEEFFTALEENSSWLKTITPGEFMSSHLPARPARICPPLLTRR